MNRLIPFFSGTGTDDHGRTVPDILSQDDEWLERTHDYVQWLFPNRYRSRVTPSAPTLDDATVEAFQANEVMMGNLKAALTRMLAFYGLESAAEGLGKAPNWNERKRVWFTRNGHNSLRITRILKCLCAVGLVDDADALLTGLVKLYHEEPDCGIDAFTMRIWREAVPRLEDDDPMAWT